MLPQYVGICDFDSPDRARQMADLFGKASKKSSQEFKLMVGVMMSYRTLHDIPSRWTVIWPPKEEVASIFVDHPHAFNTLHYADYEGIDIESSICRAASYGGPHLHAIQLDMILPYPEHIFAFREKFPHVKVVLQINERAFEMVGENPRILSSTLKRYGASVDYVLLDKSMGRGLGMDALWLWPFVDTILNSGSHLGVGVAGGLGNHTLHLVRPLVRAFPSISIDAQSKLRPSGSALDPIEWSWAEEFILKAIRMYQKTLS